MKPLVFIFIAVLLASLNQNAFSQTGADYANLGIQEYNSGYYQPAIHDLTQALPYYNDAPHQASIYNYIGGANSKLGDYDNAIAAYTHCLTLYPRDTSFYISYLDCYEHEDNYAEIIKTCNTGLTRFKDRPWMMEYLYFVRGNALPYTGQIGKSIASFTSAIALDAKNPSRYWERGNSYADTNDFAHAISDYKMAISLSSKDTKYLYKIYDDKSTYERWNGQYQDALADEQQALALNPDCAFFYLGIGRAYALLNMTNEANSALLSAIKNDSSTTLIPLALYFMGDTARAMTKVKRNMLAHADAKDNLVNDYLNAAYLMTFSNNPKAAIAYLKQGMAIGLTKSDIMYQDNLIPLRKDPDFIALLKN